MAHGTSEDACSPLREESNSKDGWYSPQNGSDWSEEEEEEECSDFKGLEGENSTFTGKSLNHDVGGTDPPTEKDEDESVDKLLAKLTDEEPPITVEAVNKENEPLTQGMDKKAGDTTMNKSEPFMENQISKDYDDDEGRSKEEAELLKTRGNDAYRAGQYLEALELYNLALDSTPRKEIELAVVIINNCAAVHMALGQWQETISCCSDAIELKPDTVKAYVRRSKAHAETSKYHEAVADLKKAIELDPSLENSNRGLLVHLEKKSNELYEKEKDEMIGKLKDMGNWALGKLGLSLDNFKVEQNPETGSYNIQFQQNAPPQAP